MKKKSTRAAASRPVSRARARPALTVDLWHLRLYIAGQTPRSLTALANLKKLCEEHLAGRYEIEIVDLLLAPERGQKDQIVALPTLVRKLPEPIKRVIGDLSNHERVRMGIDLFNPTRLAS